MQRMPKSNKALLLTLTLAFLSAGPVIGVCPVGDLSSDCEIGFEDIQVFAEQWLTDGGCAEPNCADMDGVDGVNIFDFALLTQNWRQAGHPIVINELMASNSSFVQDPQQQYDDWIELYNGGEETVDVGGMYLTNDLDTPTKWRIPANIPQTTTIVGHGYLWIWADEDTGDWPGLHAGFELDAEGGEIGLFDSNGTALVDSVAFERQTANISYGRYPDGGRNWRFLGTPSPGSQNKGAYLGEVAEPQFSRDRGFYDSAFTVTLACETEGADIYFSMDGIEPGVMSGRTRTGYRYSNPFTINKTTCLRARAIKSGWKPSRVKTHTYIFGASGAVKSLPIVSLVGDRGKTFYEPAGVMAIVGGYYSGGVWTSGGSPSAYNNPMQRGMAYERPVSFEFFNTDDGSDVQEDCGIRVHGSEWMRPRYTRCDGLWTGNCKFSFRLYFRSQYGQNELEYRLFPYGLDRSNSIALRGGHNDQVNPFIKDELLRRLHMDMGNAASIGRGANLFINGEYKGYYNPCEHIKDSFCQEYYDSDKEWDVMTMSGIRDGDTQSFDALTNYARNHDLSNDTYYAEVARRLDIPAFADYLILQLWCGNWDWPQNNWAAACERSDEGKWRFFIWDAEGGMFSDRINVVYFDGLNTQNNANGWLYRSLKSSKNFRQTFADRLYKHFYNNGAMTDVNIRKRFFELRDEMLGVIPSMDMYVLNTWVPNRFGVFLNACIGEGMFTMTGPTFRINGVNKHGGYISSTDSFSMAAGSGTVYYTIDGSDPRVPVAQASPGSVIMLVPENAAKQLLVPAGPVDPGAGSILYEYWTGISGTAVSDLTSHPDYPGNPAGEMYVTSFEGPAHWNSNYGARISGYVQPPENGSYTFWLATDDNGELWLSTDDDPANMGLIARVSGWAASREWGKSSEQQSAPIWLVAGQRYYVEAMMKEEGGGDNIAVTWRGPGVGSDPPLTDDPPIAGQYLSPPGSVWAKSGYDDSGWQSRPSGATGIGYETRPGDAVNYVALIGTNVESQMYGKNTTCYIRIPFTVGTLDIMDLTLNIRYDDGFVAYINGEKVAARNFEGTPLWNSHADIGRDDSQAVNFESIDLGAHLSTLRLGENVLAIQGLNAAPDSSDFLISAELFAYAVVVTPSGNVSPTAIKYVAPRVLTQSTQVKARVLNGSTWSALSEAVFAVGPVEESLRITEVMYHPQETGNPDDPNEEFIELRNIGLNPINLNLVRFTNGVDFTFPSWSLGVGKYVLVVRNHAAFAAQYPTVPAGMIAGQYTGSLDNGGERIELEDALGQTIHNFAYKDGWRNISDGQGFSITIIDPTNPDPNSWGRKDSWRSSAYVGGSPGQDDSGIIPNPGAIVINELLAHSHAVAPDWIELYNTTDQDIDIGGWYLSDTEIYPKKYKLADGTKIRAYDYLVLHEDANFGEASTDPGRLTGFGFSENGDNVYLRSAEGGILTGYREAESFGASYTGVSFGRYFKRSTGSYNFVHTDYNTPGWANAYPEVGPIVINEIMYNPDWPVGGNYTNDRYEYIELRNITAEPVTLYRFDKALPWKFTEGIEFVFPAWPSAVTIPAGEYIVVVRDPNVFTWRYPAVPAGKIFGPYTGQLANEGEQVELSMPGDIDEFGRRHYIRIDRVGYSDGSHPGDEPGGIDLWPVEADGGGKSLARKVASLYGNDPNNWIPAIPSPGQ